MTSADDLLLTQWLSPAFPLGGLAYSHGLEQTIADGAVHDAATLQAWLAHVLTRGAGLADAVLPAVGSACSVARRSGRARGQAAQLGEAPHSSGN